MKTSIRDIVRREKWATAYEDVLARSQRFCSECAAFHEQSDCCHLGVEVKINAWISIMRDIQADNERRMIELLEEYA